MHGVEVDLEAERRASRERRHRQLRPSRARLVREMTAEHGGIAKAAEALFGHLGEDDVARIVALAKSDDPLDDGTRRLTPEEIEAYMKTKRLDPEQRQQLREFVAAAREADPNVRPVDVYRRAKEELGIEISSATFHTTYWHAAGGARKASDRPAKRRNTARTKRRARRAVGAAASTDLLIERLEEELRQLEQRAAKIRAAIETIHELGA